MKTISAIYKGNRIIELSENLNLPEGTVVLVIIPEQDDEIEMQLHLKSASEVVFAKMWDNKDDEIWNLVQSS